MKWSLILIPLLTGCSASWHLKQAVKKDPSLLQTKTIVLTDTLELPGKTIVDTLEVPTLDQWTAWENDSLRIELSLVKDAVTGESRIKFKADIKPQTITREVKVDCPPSVIQKPSSRSRLSSFVLYALGALFVYGVGYLHGRVTGRG